VVKACGAPISSHQKATTRLLEERDRLYQVRLSELRNEVRKGLDQLDRGEGRPFDPEVTKCRLRAGVGKMKRRRPA
jgi:hypothetical protein